MSQGRMARTLTGRAPAPRPGAPRTLHVRTLTSTAVVLSWKAPRAGEPVAGYALFRGGELLARVHTRSHTDRTVRAGHRYFYSVRAFDRHGRLGPPTAAIAVRVPVHGSTPGTSGASAPAGAGLTVTTPVTTGPAGSTAGTQPAPSGATTPSAPPLTSTTAATDTTSTTTTTTSTTPPDTATSTTTATDTTPTSTTPTDTTPTETTPTGTTPIETTPTDTTPTPLTQAMVDRLFWRAGFGPTQANRDTWIGRTQADLVDWMLSQTQSYPPATVPPTHNGEPIDPTNNNQFDFLMEWLNRMQTGVNPLTERLTFFWHRHFAVASSSGIPNAWLLTYRNRLQRYGDLAANPKASFRDLAREMTTQDGAMSYFLTGDENIVGQPNENYGREFMELFTLGVFDSNGGANYTQDDVEQMARAFTGWQLDQDPDSATYGQVHFEPDYYDSGIKTIFGQTGAFNADDAVDLVLARPHHPTFLLTKLWNEFIAAPIPADALADLTAAYTAEDGLLLAPVMRKILNHELIFDSLDEPNMVKPPVVFYIGLIKAMDSPLQDYWPYVILDACQQLPYDPPNVAGWEGGLAWLNTSTVAARFDAVISSQYLKYHVNYVEQGGTGESAQQAYDLAYSAVLQPWLAPETQELLLHFSATTLSDSDDSRRERQYALRAFMLAGPDAQVM